MQPGKFAITKEKKMCGITLYGSQCSVQWCDYHEGSVNVMMQQSGYEVPSVVIGRQSLTCKILNTSVAPYLSQHINRSVNARTLRSSATPLLIQPFARTNFAKRSFRCTAPSVWNSLPAFVIGSDSLSVFKFRQKHSYFVDPLTSTQTDCRKRLWSIDLMALYK